MNPKVSIVECSAYSPDVVMESLTKAIDLIGGIDRYIKLKSQCYTNSRKQ